VLCTTALPLSAREPTRQDYEVWSAIVSDGFDPVYVWHLVESASVFDRGETKNMLYFFPEVRPVAKQWEGSAELDVHRFKSQLPVKVELLDQATLNKSAGRNSKPTWLMSPLLIPGAERIVRLSWPVYREDGRAAYVICAICTQWWGSIMHCKVDKYPSGKWRLGQNLRRNFTDWKDGKLFIDD
jgi:hypothetical protein